jgi:hypothetical protein
MRLLVALTLTMLAVAASAAQAATTRYVRLGGSTTFPNACALATPCDITAIANNNDTTIVGGDTIVVLSAVTPITLSAGLTVTKQLTIEGDPASSTRPVIALATGSGTTLTDNVANSTISHLDLRETGNTSAAIAVNAASTLSDLLLSGTYNVAAVGGGATLTDSTIILTDDATAGGNGVDFVGPGSLTSSTVDVSGASSSLQGVFTSSNDTISDVTIVSTQGGVFTNGTSTTLTRLNINAGERGVSIGTGISLTDSLVVSTTGPGVLARNGSAVVRNVTAIVANGPGMDAAASSFAPNSQGMLDARNVITRGGGAFADVVAEPVTSCAFPPCVPGAVTISYSNFRTASPTGVTDNGHEQSGDPLFVSPTNFHLQFGSPAVDAGLDDPSNGTSDLDGNPRVVATAPDLGAYESPLGTGAPTTTSPQISVPSPPPPSPPPPPPDTTKPVITKASFTHASFAVAAGATATTAAASHKRKPPRGTTLRFTLSEPATVTIQFALKTHGKRVDSRCVKPTAKLRHKSSCISLLFKGKLTRNEKTSGAQSVALTGRVGTKALAVGSYEVTLVAVDAAGNHSKTTTLGFKIVRS